MLTACLHMVQNIAAAHVPHPVCRNNTGAVGRDEAAPLFAGGDFFPNALHNAIPAFQHIHAGDAVKKGGGNPPRIFVGNHQQKFVTGFAPAFINGLHGFTLKVRAMNYAARHPEGIITRMVHGNGLAAQVIDRRTKRSLIPHQLHPLYTSAYKHRMR